MSNNSKEKIDKNHQRSLVLFYKEKHPGMTDEQAIKILKMAKKANTSFDKIYNALPEKDLTEDTQLEWLFPDAPVSKKQKYYMRKNAKNLTIDQMQELEVEKKEKAFETFQEISAWWVYEFFQAIKSGKWLNCKDTYKFFFAWAQVKYPEYDNYKNYKFTTIQSCMSEMAKAGILSKREPNQEESKRGRGEVFHLNPYYIDEPFSMEIKNKWKEAYKEMQNKVKEVSIYLKLGKIILNTCSDPTLSFSQKYGIIMRLIGEVLTQAELKSQNYATLDAMIDEIKADRKLRWDIYKEHIDNVKKMKQIKQLQKKRRRSKPLIKAIIGDNQKDDYNNKHDKPYEPKDEDYDYSDFEDL